MKKICIAFLLLTGATSAQETLTVLGNVDCGQWLKARQTNTAQHYEQYMIGLVNGMVLGGAIDIWKVNGSAVSQQQLYYWTDAYCQKNPLSNIFAGVADFADERTYGGYKKRLDKLQ